MIRNGYADTASRLAQRYTDSNGRLVTHINGEPTRYWILEGLAAVKYLGCDPSKLNILPRFYRVTQDADGEWRLRIGGAGDQGEHVPGFATLGEAVSTAWQMHHEDQAKSEEIRIAAAYSAAMEQAFHDDPTGQDYDVA